MKSQSTLARAFRCTNLILPVLMVAVWIKAYAAIPMLALVAYVYISRRRFDYLRRRFWTLSRRWRNAASWVGAGLCAALAAHVTLTCFVTFAYVDFSAVGPDTEPRWTVINRLHYGAARHADDVRRYHRTHATSHIKRGDVAIVDMWQATGRHDGCRYKAFRIAALPSDTIAISGGLTSVNSQPSPTDLHATDRFRMRKYTPVAERRAIIRTATHSMVDDEGETDLTMPVSQARLWKRYVYSKVPANYPDRRMFVHHNGILLWNGQNLGPMLMPHKGLTMTMNHATVEAYRTIATRHEGRTPQAGQPYTFAADYYWLTADNRPATADSRFVGPVPESCIVARAD